MTSSLSIALILLAALSSHAGAPVLGVSLDKAAGILGLLDPGAGAAPSRKLGALLSAHSSPVRSSAPGLLGGLDSLPAQPASLAQPGLRGLLRLDPHVLGCASYTPCCRLVRGP